MNIKKIALKILKNGGRGVISAACKAMQFPASAVKVDLTLLNWIWQA